MAVLYIAFVWLKLVAIRVVEIALTAARDNPLLFFAQTLAGVLACLLSQVSVQIAGRHDIARGHSLNREAFS
jgi:hypothetical protein